jgi:hypothetical protein
MEVSKGTTATFTITANEGYSIERVAVDGTDIGTTTTYTFSNVQDDHTISVVFATANVAENLDELTIQGRFVHAFTGAPLPNIPMKHLVPPSTLYSTFMQSDANGEFTFMVNTQDIAPTKSKPYTYYGVSCYMSGVSSGLAVITRNEDNSLMLGRNPFDLIPPGSLYINPITTRNINLGNIPLWPSKKIIINSDISVKFKVEYPEERSSLGNTLYKTAHVLSATVPLDYDTVVKLTDEAGNVYTSPAYRYSRDAGCSDAVLTFSNGVFTWQ